MKLGKPEILSLVLAVIIPQFLVYLVPTKTTALFIFMLLIILIYILLKREEINESKDKQPSRITH